MEALKAKRTWSEVFQVLNENIFSPWILYKQNYHSKLMEQ
jgi:hypothetical protein